MIVPQQSTRQQAGKQEQQFDIATSRGDLGIEGADNQEQPSWLDARGAQSQPCEAKLVDVTPTIHAALQRRKLLQRTHIVDTGFLYAALLVEI